MGPQPLIAGALFDFTSWLTCQRKTLRAGASESSPKVLESLQRWAFERGFSLDEPDLEWHRTASVVFLEDLYREGNDTRKRINGALHDFAHHIASMPSSDLETSLIRFAAARELDISNPQPRWQACWWA